MSKWLLATLTVIALPYLWHGEVYARVLHTPTIFIPPTDFDGGDVL